MNKTPPLVFQVERALRDITRYENPLSVEDFLCWSAEKNELVVVEGLPDDGLELQVRLTADLHQKIAEKKMPSDFELSFLPTLAVLIEELSHFHTFCARASDDKRVSALELEVQAEVDKFAVCLEWLEKRNEMNFADQVFDALFENYRLAEWVKEEEKTRYHDAHAIARQFCRSILAENIEDIEVRRSRFQKFFEKRGPEKFGAGL